LCEFGGSIVGAEEFFCGAAFGVFDLLEIEEAYLRAAPEKPVAVVLST
jgi:hypothetical protein